MVSGSIVEAWRLVSNDVKLRTVKHVDRDTEEKTVKGWLEQADHNVIVQRCHFVGLTLFSDDAGDSKTTFVWYIGGGMTMTWMKVGFIDPADKYVCTSDRIEIEDYVNGSGWEEQVWELVSKMKPVAGSYYEESAASS
jgi:hypothetical protein